MKNFLHRRPTVLTVAAGLFIVQAVCFHAGAENDVQADPATSASPTQTPPKAADAPPLWLGDPGVDADKARAAHREKVDAALRWETAANRDAYDRFGTRNPSWDDDARRCIELTSLPSGATTAASMSAYQDQLTTCGRALKNGCTDPFVAGIGARLKIVTPGGNEDQLARTYSDVERDMDRSDYPPFQKFLAAAAAVHQEVIRRRAGDNTIGQQMPGYAQPAVSWPEGTDPKAAFEHAAAQLELLLKDPAIAPLLYMDSVEKFFRDASSDPVGRAEALVPLAKFFEQNAVDGHPTYAAKLIEGRFWTDYAWDARGGETAGAVTEDGWKFFSERLEKAAAALAEAWKLDPGDALASRCMITVAMGQGRDRVDMEQWFRRAMDALPNYYAAGFAKMLFLEPKWGGSWEAVLEFGRQCYATRDYSTRMAMLLLSAHIRLSHAQANATAYWKQPDVWTDVHNLYTGYLEWNPTSRFDRTAYALYASYAEQWQAAHEQFEWLGDKPDLEMLGLERLSVEKFREMRRRAAEHTKAAAPGDGGGGS